MNASLRTSALGSLLDSEGLTQREVAAGVGVDESFISRLVRGETGASQSTINAALRFLSVRLGRQVTYEEAFGSSSGSGLPAAVGE